MRCHKRDNCYYYTDGSGKSRIHRPVHKLWAELTGERLLPILTKRSAESFALEIFKLLHSPAQSDGRSFTRALREYLAHCESDSETPRTLFQKHHQLLRFAADRKIETLNQITARTIQSWLDDLPISASSRNRYLSIISDFCRFCRRSGMMAHRPAADVDRYREIRKSEPHIFTRQEVDLLKLNTDPIFAAILELAYQTGMRRGEIHWLWSGDWATVDLRAAIALFPAGVTKSRKSDVRYLNKSAREAIRFLSESGARCPRIDNISNKFVDLRTRLGMPCRFHDFRHTFASRVARSTAHPQPKHIATALGHLTQGLADRVYIHPDADFQRQLVESLPD